MEISSSRGPWEASFSSRGLIFGVEEISIPETRPIRKSYICAYIDSNRNTISEWAVIFRYGNFFIPRVEEISIPEKRPIRKLYIFEQFQRFLAQCAAKRRRRQHGQKQPQKSVSDPGKFFS